MDTPRTPLDANNQPIVIGGLYRVVNQEYALLTSGSIVQAVSEYTDGTYGIVYCRLVLGNVRSDTHCNITTAVNRGYRVFSDALEAVPCD